ncbi:hypothetical protein P879_11164 [Paragonimus westermani]|uniref:Peptidase A2 domain-containing protein n=1 Tax=Paragonimus westermani TaxID=34504 RepID=A0A8T0D4U6_9TREM|nr:hypothetical protein P879_11164 [Paragonimus westermani]
MELPVVYREKFFSHRQKPEESVDRLLRDLRQLASKAFKHLTPVQCERNICERFRMGLRNRDLRTKFILKPTENLSVALTKARGCEALEQLDEKRAAEDSVGSAFHQHCLTPEPLPRRNQPAVPVGGECYYCKRFGRRAQHCGHNPPTGSRSPSGEPLTLHEALSSVISPQCVVTMTPLSVRGSINKEPVLFLVDTGVPCCLIHARLATRLTKHRTAPAKPVRLLAANGTEMQMASSPSAKVQLGSFSGEHQFLACTHLQLKAIDPPCTTASEGISLSTMLMRFSVYVWTAITTYLCDIMNIVIFSSLTGKPVLGPRSPAVLVNELYVKWRPVGQWI